MAGNYLEAGREVSGCPMCEQRGDPVYDQVAVTTC